MKKLLKSNGKPTISGNDKMLYADKNLNTEGGHDSYVSDEVTYEYEVISSDTKPNDHIIVPGYFSSSTLSISGTVNEVKNGQSSVKNYVENLPILIYDGCYLRGMTKWHEIEVPWEVSKAYGYAEVLYARKKSDGSFEYYLTQTSEELNDQLIEYNWYPSAILAATREQLGKDYDLFISLNNLLSSYAVGYNTRSKYDNKNVYSYGNGFCFGLYRYTQTAITSSTGTLMAYNPLTTGKEIIPLGEMEEYINTASTTQTINITDGKKATEIYVDWFRTTNKNGFDAITSVSSVQNVCGEVQNEYSKTDEIIVLARYDENNIPIYSSTTESSRKYLDFYWGEKCDVNSAWCPSVMSTYFYESYGIPSSGHSWYLPSIKELIIGFSKHSIINLEKSINAIKPSLIQMYNTIDDKYTSDENDPNIKKTAIGDKIYKYFIRKTLDYRDNKYFVNDNSIELSIDNVAHYSYNSSTFTSQNNGSTTNTCFSYDIGKENFLVDARRSGNNVRAFMRGTFRSTDKIHETK